MPAFREATKHRYQHYTGQLQENGERTRNTRVPSLRPTARAPAQAPQLPPWVAELLSTDKIKTVPAGAGPVAADVRICDFDEN